jgi:hypothetical protein
MRYAAIGPAAPRLMRVDTSAPPLHSRAHHSSGLITPTGRRPHESPTGSSWTRRRFLGGVTLAGTAGLLGLDAGPVAAEPPPETTTLRLDQWPALCFPPLVCG